MCLGHFGFWILDFGFWILDFGFWILDYPAIEVQRVCRLLDQIGNSKYALFC
jgi:hypothetical protein